ncbi:glycoside hydrolase family 32 protein [Clostridium magnum]|uniref:Sucrose-6-phosphate hydrolase n=1 Tax=Clostridium magnum DSM 2767 TaxID=1121326 RepID=A0A161VCX9_9CLOT|nr:sucrose-6-phosphate hydrolase [Clostridium magnum]KZL91561.1 sucrose-6-phosphate hydrolase [Clostridium magnum DSM 2767]SHH47662.1 beta-fructofuranosidase [Clostridium magnum DSM 2767]
MNKNEELLKKAYDRIEETKELVESDYYRLKYHIMPPVGLLNDPNGFVQINDEYHLFYQFHPFGTKHGLKYWAHVKSKDLVNWVECPIALAPSEWYETHGCYSGSGINDNGVLTLIYTGNVKDENGNRETYQCLVTSEDGVNFKKYENNPVIYNQPEGYTRHFRDPKVWKKDEIWYMVIGAQTINNEGKVLLFKSVDLKDWSLVGDTAGSSLNDLGYFGYMWECPDLFSLKGKDILIASPQGLESKGDLYNNIYQSGYFVGKLNYDSGRLIHGEFTELDRGFEFYAPQTTLDNKGRRILIAWMGLPEEENHPTTEHGWIHTMTISRVLELVGDKIYQKPVEEFKSLRKNEMFYQDITIDNDVIELENINGDVLELLIEFQVEDAAEYGVKLRTSEDGSEETVLFYNRESKKFEFNREKSGRALSGVRRCQLEDRKILKLNIFMDRSSIEVFINDGEEVFSARVFPDENSKGIKLFARGGRVKVKNLIMWDLR